MVGIVLVLGVGGGTVGVLPVGVPPSRLVEAFCGIWFPTDWDTGAMSASISCCLLSASCCCLSSSCLARCLSMSKISCVRVAISEGNSAIPGVVFLSVLTLLRNFRRNINVSLYQVDPSESKITTNYTRQLE